MSIECEIENVVDPQTMFPWAEMDRQKVFQEAKILDSPPEKEYDRITKLCSRVFKVPIVAVSLVDINRLWFKSRVGLDISEYQRAGSFCSHAISNLRFSILRVNDCLQDPRFVNHPLVANPPFIRFYAGVCIIVNGVRLGTLCLLDSKTRTNRSFTVQDEQILYECSAIISDLISKRRTEYVKLANHYVTLNAKLMQLVKIPLTTLQEQLHTIQEKYVAVKQAIQSSSSNKDSQREVKEKLILALEKELNGFNLESLRFQELVMLICHFIYSLISTTTSHSKLVNRAFTHFMQRPGPCQPTIVTEDLCNPIQTLVRNAELEEKKEELEQTLNFLNGLRQSSFTAKSEMIQMIRKTQSQIFTRQLDQVTCEFDPTLLMYHQSREQLYTYKGLLRIILFLVHEVCYGLSPYYHYQVKVSKAELDHNDEPTVKNEPRSVNAPTNAVQFDSLLVEQFGLQIEISAEALLTSPRVSTPSPQQLEKDQEIYEQLLQSIIELIMIIPGCAFSFPSGMPASPPPPPPTLSPTHTAAQQKLPTLQILLPLYLLRDLKDIEVVEGEISGQWSQRLKKKPKSKIDEEHVLDEGIAVKQKEKTEIKKAKAVSTAKVFKIAVKSMWRLLKKGLAGRESSGTIVPILAFDDEEDNSETTNEEEYSSNLTDSSVRHSTTHSDAKALLTYPSVEEITVTVH